MKLEDVSRHRVVQFLKVILTEDFLWPKLDLNRHMPLLIILPAIILPERDGLSGSLELSSLAQFIHQATASG